MLNNQGPAEPSVFYEVWLIGPNGLADMTLGVITVFERHFKLTLNEKERAAVANRVLTRINSTVDVKSLRPATRDKDSDSDGSR